VVFLGDAHRESGVISLCFALSPVESCSPPELVELTPQIYSSVLPNASEQFEEREKSLIELVEIIEQTDCLLIELIQTAVGSAPEILPRSSGSRRGHRRLRLLTNSKAWRARFMGPYCTTLNSAFACWALRRECNRLDRKAPLGKQAREPRFRAKDCSHPDIQHVWCRRLSCANQGRPWLNAVFT